MSIYYTVACHTCEERINLAGYTTEAVSSKAGDFATYAHMSHNVIVINDASCGWDEKFDKIYDEVMEYKEKEVNHEK